MISKTIRLVAIVFVLLLTMGACTMVVILASPDIGDRSVSAVEDDPAEGGVTDGTWEVGVDIAAGKYKSAGGETCYWERQSSDSGTLGSIIVNSNSPGPQVVRIKASDFAFKTSGCPEWFLQEDQ